MDVRSMNSDLVQQLSMEEKVGRLFFIGIPGPEMDPQTVDLLRFVRPGGVCLFARNIKGPEQTRELLDSIRELLGYEPFLSLDQEGGTVDRLRRIVEPMPAPGSIRTAEDATELARIIARTVRTLGFNTDFAPVVDIATEDRSGFSNGLRSRTFGHSVDESVLFAAAFLKELQAGGCLGCIKHFPGLGAAEVDSHEELPLVNINEEVFEDVDLYPYKVLFAKEAVHVVMVAHAAYPNCLGTRPSGRLLPSSLSRSVVNGLLRDKMGFDGIAITDDLEMGAILKGFGIEEACRLALSAGEDMLAICAGDTSIRNGYAAVLEAVNSGELTEDRVDTSVSRIERLRSTIPPAPQMDTTLIAGSSNEIKALKTRLI